MRRAVLPSGAGKGNSVVAVAVDSDRNSQYALRWAGDHLLAPGHIFYLLHIRRKISAVPTPGKICVVFVAFPLFLFFFSFVPDPKSFHCKNGGTRREMWKFGSYVSNYSISNLLVMELMAMHLNSIFQMTPHFFCY
jgi:hypothetical protein